MTASDPLLVLEGVTKEFANGPDHQRVLDNVGLQVYAGDSVAVVGPSGSGKSTLLNLIAGLDRPTSGTVYFRNQDLGGMAPDEMAAYRNRAIGFVFQMHHLLPQCTVLENVLVPTLVRDEAEGAKARALELLERVGLADKVERRPGVLSGGERQRAAVVRALINRPAMLLADEPTGSLHAESADALAALLLELNREEGMILIAVTHAPAIARKMARVFALRDGQLITQSDGVMP